MSNLTKREAQVIRMRFGIGMNTDHTLEDIAKQLRISPERVRQIEAKALRKLRGSKTIDKLKSFADWDGKNK